MSLYLYLGGQGSNYTSIDKAKDPVPGGWNFGGKGGLDFYDSDGTNDQPESGVDIRLEYYDINSNPLNDSAFMSPPKSRIIVAGSGGGSCAGDRPMGMSGGAIESPTNYESMFGGSQTLGNLGFGIDGIQTSDNKGGTGGYGSGYKGGYYDANLASKESYFEYGAMGGSSYISGHPGCINLFLQILLIVIEVLSISLIFSSQTP